ncbi:MAG: hypothetical protein H5T62_03810 [Anaerolineae bacterium]|nr:hypothetical protein [Anaerolineae bacterium]
MNGAERLAAERLSTEIDRLLQGEEAVGIEEELRATVERLAGLHRLLEPPDAALRRRVWARVQRAQSIGRGWRRRPMTRAWAAVALALVLLAVVIGVSPPGRQAIAEVMGVFQLGRIEVRVTPRATVQPGVEHQVTREEVLPDLAAAEELVGYELLTPASLPEGYDLYAVRAVYYDDLPAWVPQPFYIDLDYRPPGGDAHPYYLRLREYRLSFGGPGDGISALRFAAGEVSLADDVDLDGRRGVLLHLPGAAFPPEEVLLEVVWEQDGVVLELMSQELSAEELVAVARSVE